MKLADLNEAPWNPRSATQEELELLKASLLDLGDLSGIIYNQQTGNLAGGHQRTKIFKEIAPDIEIIIDQQFTAPTKQGTVKIGHFIYQGEQYAYREVKWPPEREKLANLAANNISGTWDAPKLGLILEKVVQEENGLAHLKAVGFGKQFLSDYLQDKQNLSRLLVSDMLGRMMPSSKNAVDADDTVRTVEQSFLRLAQPEFDERIETGSTCPKCGYKFSS